MLTYDPPTLEDDLKKAHQLFSPHEFITDLYNITETDFDKKQTNDVVNFDTEIYFNLPYQGEKLITVKDYIELAEEVAKTKLINNVKVHSEKRGLYLVTTNNYEHLDSIIKWVNDKEKQILKTNVKTDRGEVECSLIGGVTLFGIMIALKEDYEDYFPPLLVEHDIFIQLKYSTPHSIDECDRLVEAYIFELSSSAQINLVPTRRPHIKEIKLMPDLGEEAEPKEIDYKLRPLMIGKGMQELLSLFNKALLTDDPEIKIIYYTKVFEYVSQSIIRSQLLSVIQSKLNSPKVLAPDAEYILELQKIYKEQDIYKKDGEAVLLTIVQCCDAFELAKVSPKYLKHLAEINILSSKEERDIALKEIAKSIVDTRNMFAHAKSNYKPTSFECPNDQITEFSQCLNIAAQQVIRHFNNLTENNRVIVS